MKATVPEATAETKLNNVEISGKDPQVQDQPTTGGNKLTFATCYVCLLTLSFAEGLNPTNPIQPVKGMCSRIISLN